MAGKIKFAETLRRPLQSAKSDCLSKISTGDGIKIVSDFFRELDGALESWIKSITIVREIDTYNDCCLHEEW